MFHDIQRVQQLRKTLADLEHAFLEIHERVRNPYFKEKAKFVAMDVATIAQILLEEPNTLLPVEIERRNLDSVENFTRLFAMQLESFNEKFRKFHETFLKHGYDVAMLELN